MNLLLRPKFHEEVKRRSQVVQLVVEDGDDELIPIVVAIAER